MALATSTGCTPASPPPNDTNELVNRQNADLDGDSGNEQSVGGSSSEGDSMSHHAHEISLDHQQHSPSVIRSISSEATSFNAPFANLTPLQASSDFSPAFNTHAGSLFDTPPSLNNSVENQQKQVFDMFSPTYGSFQPFQCAVCNKPSQMGVLQFICAHRTCGSCQMSPSDALRGCAICGAAPSSSANFPPQMFLSPTQTSSPQTAGANSTLFDSSPSKSSASTPRAFSFSLNGLPQSPSPLLGGGMRVTSSTPTALAPMRPFPSLALSDMDSLNTWTPLAPPPSLNLRSSISPPHPNFDTLSVNDDAPVFSPLSPTNTSNMLPPMDSPSPPKHSIPIAPPNVSSGMVLPPPLLPPPLSTGLLGLQPNQLPPIPPPTLPPLLPSVLNQFISPHCQGCDTNPSFALCLNCNETLCQHCVQAHQRVRATKSHAVIELSQLIGQFMHRQLNAQRLNNEPIRSPRRNLGSGASHGDGQNSLGEQESLSGDSSPRSSSVCSVHESRIVGFCKNCPKTMALCAVCVAQHPNKHRVQPIGDLRLAVGELINESCMMEWQCEKTADTISRLAEGVINNATVAEKEVRTSIDSLINALEERKMDLLKRVETVKNLKLSVLLNQDEKLKRKRVDLKTAIQAATAAVEANTGDEMELREIFEKLATCQMCGGGKGGVEPNNNNLMNVIMLACQLNEDDRLKFVAPQDGQLLNKVRQYGTIESGPCAKTSSIVGDGFRKAIRERQSVIYIQLRDACGDLLSSSIAATQATNHALLPNQTANTRLEKALPTSDVHAIVLSPDGVPLDVSMTPRENGIVAISYYPMMEGTYSLNVLVKGTSINGCPVNLEVRRGRNYDEIAARGPIMTFGKEGSGDGELCRPWGICIDLLGRVLVADRSNNRIQIFDKDGNFLSKFGTGGNRPGQFDRPAGITVNTCNNIIVADKDNHRIQVFDENGNFILKFGDRGRAVGYFNYPWGVATNSHNAIAVSDTRNHRVQIFTSQGQFVRKCGFDSAYFFKNLDSPRGLCYLPDGQLLITDFNNHRLAVLSPRNMSEMKVYGSEGDADGMFVRPQGVKIDPEGHILVCDSRNNRIQVFSSDDMRFIGSFGLGPANPQSAGFQMPAELATPYSSPSGPFGAPAFSATPTPLTPSPRQLLDRPTDLAVGPDGRIYVVDFGNNCIRVF